LRGRGTRGAADVGFKGEMRSKEEVVMMYGRGFDDLNGHVWEVVWMREGGCGAGGGVEGVEGEE
jgi:predicted lactoylglutathione lyase